MRSCRIFVYSSCYIPTLTTFKLTSLPLSVIAQLQFVVLNASQIAFHFNLIAILKYGKILLTFSLLSSGNVASSFCVCVSEVGPLSSALITLMISSCSNTRKERTNQRTSSQFQIWNVWPMPTTNKQCFANWPPTTTKRHYHCTMDAIFFNSTIVPQSTECPVAWNWLDSNWILFCIFREKTELN